MTTVQRSVDAKGRVVLGTAFANSTVIVQHIAEGVVQIVRGKTVPDPELWLHKNPEAIRMVMEGIEQARRGELVDGPDLGAAAKLAEEMSL